MQCKSINTTSIVLTQKAIQYQVSSYIAVLNNYYWLLLSIQVLHFGQSFVSSHKLELLFHLFPFLLCQIFVHRGYKHQKASKYQWHSAYPQPLKSYSNQSDNTPGAKSSPGAMRPIHFLPFTFAIFQHHPKRKPSGHFSLLEFQLFIALCFSSSPHFPLCPLRQDNSASLTSSSTTSWSMWTP